MLGPTGLPVSSRTSMWPPLLPAVQAAKMTGADTLLTASDDIARYGVYSLFPSSGAPQLCQPRFASASAGAFHPTHKVQSLSISDSLFGGYSFGGAPTPPPGSPYSPLRLELLSKTLSSSTTSSCITTAAAAANDTACWMEPLQVKTEIPGCSRTTPAHTALLQVGEIKVKREPQATPCQVSEISTSHHNQHHANGGGPADASLATALVKMEANTSPKSSDQGVSSIPVGIAVARQRLNQEVPLALAPGTQIIGATSTKETRCSEIGLRDPSGLIPLGADTIIGTSVPSVWPVSTTQTSLGPPTLWQYPGE
ncbi:uncharacterized protein LOC113374819 [Ctenocephalides felis]|uniref:uncharacterized protein LOC113374819 n=1 Tax=Ctenocephalides felis TaxID=7515 RepID=UPI000E6E30E4|nr:uncharacterized protein LOC113374819 [Ctenocephalides felis]